MYACIFSQNWETVVRQQYSSQYSASEAVFQSSPTQSEKNQNIDDRLTNIGP